MTKLYFFIKLARAGGSTYADKWRMEEPNRVVVCADDMRLALHGQRHCKSAEISVFEKVYYMKKALLRRGHTILVDETNTSLRSIRENLQLDINAQPILINTPLDECIRRAHATNQGDLVDPIKRMHLNLLDIWCRYAPNKYLGLDSSGYFRIEQTTQADWVNIVNSIRSTI